MVTLTRKMAAANKGRRSTPPTRSWWAGPQHTIYIYEYVHPSIHHPFNRDRSLHCCRIQSYVGSEVTQLENPKQEDTVFDTLHRHRQNHTPRTVHTPNYRTGSKTFSLSNHRQLPYCCSHGKKPAGRKSASLVLYC